MSTKGSGYRPCSVNDPTVSLEVLIPHDLGLTDLNERYTNQECR